MTVFPVIIKDHFVTINRVRGKVTRTAIYTTLGGLFELILAAVGGMLVAGLWGFAAGWLLALCIEAACMTPFLYRVVAVQRDQPRRGGAARERGLRAALAGNAGGRHDGVSGEPLAADRH